MENAYVDRFQINVRAGAGTSYGVSTKLAQGDSVMCCIYRKQIQDGGTWVRIRAGDVEGWVNEKLLSKTPPSEFERPSIAGLNQGTRAVSFDCTKTTKDAEKLICSDRELSALDGRMAEAYRLVAAASPYRERFKSEQRDWLKNHRNTCATIECLRTVYQVRIRALEAASGQMGVSSGTQQSGSVVPSRTGTFMNELVAQMIRDGEVQSDCVSESVGKIDKLFDVSTIDLNGDGMPELQVTGLGCACQGARRCMVWIYRSTTGGSYERIFGASPADTITPERIATKGYLDLVETGVSGNDICASTYKFDGRRYREVRGSLSCSPAD